MLTKEEILTAELATRMYTRWVDVDVVHAVELAKEIIEESKETKPKAGLTPIKRKKLVRRVREFDA